MPRGESAARRAVFLKGFTRRLPRGGTHVFAVERVLPARERVRKRSCLLAFQV